MYDILGANIHNKIAVSLVDAMIENIENRYLLKIFSKDILTLQLTDDSSFTNNIHPKLDTLLEVSKICRWS